MDLKIDLLSDPMTPDPKNLVPFDVPRQGLSDDMSHGGYLFWSNLVLLWVTGRYPGLDSDPEKKLIFLILDKFSIT